ncbi:SUN domain-containing protein 3-like [Scomber scombrus]|uniref:SUN domain-containing protein 3-like n=1 Tax=Scomber scombrus TaxID=13677 RepID=A0AAV1PC83_SCOSC
MMDYDENRASYIDMMEYNDIDCDETPHTRRTQHNGTQTDWTTETTTTQTRTTWKTANTRNNSREPLTSLRNFGNCLFLIFLVLGVTSYLQLYSDFIKLQQEVETFLPQAHQMPNFALESQGARVLPSRSSDTYWPQENFRTWDKLFSWWHSPKAQRQVIQAYTPLQPGNCWSFSGELGHLFVSLSHPVSITHVTLGHIKFSQSPYTSHQSVASAPRSFSIYGMTTEDEEGTFLGSSVYNQDGTSYQTFKVKPDKGVFRYVKLQVESNWGNEECTCLYNFRVHGIPPAYLHAHSAGREVYVREKGLNGDYIF